MNLLDFMPYDEDLSTILKEVEINLNEVKINSQVEENQLRESKTEIVLNNFELSRMKELFTMFKYLQYLYKLNIEFNDLMTLSVDIDIIIEYFKNLHYGFTNRRICDKMVEGHMSDDLYILNKCYDIICNIIELLFLFKRDDISEELDREMTIILYVMIKQKLQLNEIITNSYKTSRKHQ